MNRTSGSANARNRSTKSGFMRRATLQAPELQAEAPGLECALRFRDLLPVSMVLAIGVGRRCKSADRHPARPRNRAIDRFGHGRILPTPMRVSDGARTRAAPLCPCATAPIRVRSLQPVARSPVTPAFGRPHAERPRQRRSTRDPCGNARAAVRSTTPESCGPLSSRLRPTLVTWGLTKTAQDSGLKGSRVRTQEARGSGTRRSADAFVRFEVLRQ
jgi:hypothetical protein